MFTLEESRLLARMLRVLEAALALGVGVGVVWYLRHHGFSLLPHRNPVPGMLHRTAVQWFTPSGSARMSARR